MALKMYEVVAELNYNAQNWQVLNIKANSERNARKHAEYTFKKNGALTVKIVNVSEVKK